MDASGGIAAKKKRRAVTAAAASDAASDAKDLAPQLPLAARKKPRRRDGVSGRESEFLSVEVGMRELRKRLVSGDGEAAKAKQQRRLKDGGREEEKAPTSAGQHGQTTVTQATTAKRATGREPASGKRAAVKTPAAAKKSPVTRKTTASKKTAVLSAEKKPTLAEVRMQMQQEQQARVASRVQELKDAKAKTADASADVSHAAATASGRSDTSGVAPASSLVVAPIAAPLLPPPVTHEQPAATPSASDSGCVPSVSQALDVAATTPVMNALGVLPVTQTSPSAPAVTNEFIDDDMDEDLIFLMALDEVEKKLGTPSKSVVGAATSISDASTVNQEMTQQTKETLTSPAVKQKVNNPSEPIASQTITVQQPQPEPATIQQPPSIMSPDDVLREFERLKRENEELRKSNERLQAVASTRASPSPTDSIAAAALLLDNGALCASAPPADAPLQTRRVLDLGGDEESHDTGDHASPVVSAQHERIEAPPASTPSLPKRQPRLAKHAMNSLKETQAPEPSRISVLDLSPAPVPAPQRQEEVLIPTGVPENTPAALSSAVVHEQERVLDMQTQEPKTSKHHESESDAAPSPSQTSTRGDGDSDGEVVHSEEDEEEEYHETRAVTIDCGNYSEYKQGQQDEENDDEEKEEEEEGHKASHEPVHDDVEMEVVNDFPLAKMVGLSTSAPQTKHSSGQATSINLVDDEDEDAVTSLPSEPVSSVEVDEDEEEEESFASAKRSSRPAAIESSSSEPSDDSSNSENEDMGESNTSSGVKNALEAALRAASSTSGTKKKFAPHAPAPRHAANGPVSVAATRISAVKAKSNQKRTAPTSSTTALGSAQAGAKKRARSDSLSLASNASATSKPKGSSSTTATIRSTLLWPALDDFYDFLLDLSPGHVGGGGGQRNDWSASSSSLRRFAGRKIPTRYESVEQYCTTQLDAITEELLASIGNNAGSRGGGGHGKSFYLTSVSQCNPNLNANAQIFSESGFTGAARNANDYILTFRPLPRQRGPSDNSKRSSGGSLDLMSGDLISLRSPQWKSFELFVYGVVLCNSVMGDSGGNTGSSGSGSMSGDGSDQVCVLVRVQHHRRAADEEDNDEKTLLANFSVVTELCLSNQRASKWGWLIQHVHNTTTSAREYQAIKSMAFFPSDLRKTLLDGTLPTASGEKECEDDRAEDVLSPELKKRLEQQYNASQMSAIVGCLGEDKTVMIQGPPGTGKTKTVLGLLSALLDGAGLSTLRKGTARIRIGASLQSGKNSGNGPRNNSVRILVAAPSNAAVDELVVRVVSEGLVDGSTGKSYRPRMVRVGRPESVSSNSSHLHISNEREASAAKKTRGKMRKYAAEVEDILLETQVARQKASFGTARAARQAIVRGAQIVFCTLSGAGSVALCDFAHEFDALIIDEAAQAVEASALIPFKFRPHRAILVGDHRQLPATVLSKRLVAIGYDRSLFQRLVENGSRVRLLTRQYRMHPDIARFPSTYFYGGKLVQDPQLARSTARAFHAHALFRPLAFIDVAGGEQSQVSGSTSLRNLSEVELVVLLVRSLLRRFPELEWKKTIGVIAPYKQQIFELGARMAQLERELDVRLGIEVNTVDGFQGREKDIIIYSCVRTSAGGRRKKQRKNRAGDVSADAFWADERRMNVAITRARSSLWILGNSRLLEQSAAWRALIKDTRGRRAYFSDEIARKLLLPPTVRGNVEDDA